MRNPPPSDLKLGRKSLWNSDRCEHVSYHPFRSSTSKEQQWYHSDEGYASHRAEEMAVQVHRIA